MTPDVLLLHLPFVSLWVLESALCWVHNSKSLSLYCTSGAKWVSAVIESRVLGSAGFLGPFCYQNLSGSTRVSGIQTGSFINRNKSHWHRIHKTFWLLSSCTGSSAEFISWLSFHFCRAKSDTMKIYLGLCSHRKSREGQELCNPAAQEQITSCSSQYLHICCCFQKARGQVLLLMHVHVCVCMCDTYVHT